MNPADLLWRLMLLLRAHSASIIIIQTPSIDVFERERAHLPCTYIATERETNGAFRWYKKCKNETCMVSNNSRDFLGRIAMTDRHSFRENKDASITISTTRLADSGTYYCQVEMFDVGTETGPGTILTVKPAAASKVNVFQTPPFIEATEGETVHLLCTYNTSGVQHTGAFSWYKDVRDGGEEYRVSNTSAKYSGRIMDVERSSFKANRNATIAITNVNHNDSGTYYCQVEIFFVGKDTGAGTILTVKPSAARKVNVFQTPPSIEATEGETVHLLCTYNTSYVQHTGAFSWYKDVRDGTEESRVSNTSAKYSGRIMEVERSSFKANRHATIAITNVNHNDSGTYYCQVEIFFVGKDTGAGTILTVKHRDHPEKRGRSLPWQLLELGVKLAVFVLLILLTIFLVHFCESRGSPMAIIAEREEVELTDRYV